MGVFAALVWGLHDLVVRIVSPKGSVAPLLFTALMAGLVLLVPVVMLTEGEDRLKPGSTGLALLSGVTFAGASIGLYRAFAIGPVYLVAPICGAYPVLSLTFAALQGQGGTWGDWLAVGALIAGLALAASEREDVTEGSRSRRAAVLWALLGASGFAITFALAQHAAAEGGALTVTLLARFAALSLVGAWLLLGRFGLGSALAHWRALVLLGALDATAISLVVAAAGFPSPEYAAVASSVFGLVTILLAWRFLREPMRPVQWVGVLIVFAAIGTVAA